MSRCVCIACGSFYWPDVIILEFLVDSPAYQRPNSFHADVQHFCEFFKKVDVEILHTYMSKPHSQLTTRHQCNWPIHATA